MTEELLNNEMLLTYFGGDELAAEVWWNKYRIDGEETPDDMFDRIAEELTRILHIRLSSTNKLNLYHALNTKYHATFETDGSYSELIARKFLLSRPDIWEEILEHYRCGSLFKFVRGSLGFDKIIPGGSMLNAIGNQEELSSISNCFVIGSPHDSLSGINFGEFELSNIEKRRGGVGTDLSTLRPHGAVVNNQSKYSSGVTLFAESYSNKNKIIAQNGRRGALMLSLSVRHPDTELFVKSKQDLTKITTANVSIKIDQEFYDAVKSDSTYIQIFPIDTDISKIKHDLIKNAEEYNKLYEYKIGDKTVYYQLIKARELWDELIYNSWKTAEPGILFECNWEKYGLDYGYEQYRPVSTNPCSEIPMQPYDSCRLMSVNQYSFVEDPFTESAVFDFESYERMSYIQLLLIDLAIDLEIETIDKIIDKIKTDENGPDWILRKLEIGTWERIREQTMDGRRCGCGFTGLHDTLAAKGLKYSSDNLDFIEKIFQSKLKGEYEATVDLAIITAEPFEGYDFKKEENCEFYKMLQKLYPETTMKMLRYGRRNVSWSTAAPTGSLSILAGTTSGIEPLFMPFYKRRKKCVTEHSRVDFIDLDGEKFSEYFVIHPKLIEWFHVNDCFDDDLITVRKYMENNMYQERLTDIFKESPYYNSTANDISYIERIDIQSIVQKYTTHAISSTINLPKETTQETISDIFKLSIEKGLKGNTIYRDGSRQGIMVSVDEERLPSKRPKIIDGILHKIDYKKKQYSVLVGFIDGKPYEVFILTDATKHLDDEIKHLDEIEGSITKHDSNLYSFEADIDDYNDEDIELSLYDLDDMEDREEKIISLFISKMLREGISIDSVVDIMEKSQPFIGTINQKIMKVLSKYSRVSGEPCPSCGSELIRENGCKMCKNCGWSAC